MKRLITTVLALCFSLNMVVSSYADATGPLTVHATEAEATTEAKSSSPAASDSTGTKSDASNPIGDDASYYNVSDLSDAPDITADSAILMDATTGAILYQKEAETKRYPASITKTMTALLAIENLNMDDTVTFSNTAVNGVEAGSSSAGIPVGAELTVEETLYAMMLVSANEAAAALAEQVSGSVDDFATLMTQRAKELGCTNTTFKNPHGLPDEEHVTTAHDMALILQKAMQYDEFRKIAGTVTYTIPSRKTMSDTLELWNHAKILRESTEYYYKYCEGAKTGYTQAAHNTLVSYSKKDDVELICVILKDYGADCSYNDSIALYKWGFNKLKGLRTLSDYSLDDALSSSSDISKDQLKDIQSLGCTFNKDYYTLVPDSFDTGTLSKTFELSEDKQNGILGYINISSDGNAIGRCPVKYDTTSDAAVQYINGGSSNESGNDQSSGSSSSISSNPIVKSIKAILVFLGIMIIIVLIIAVIILNYMKNKKRKRKQQKIAKKIHRDASAGGGSQNTQRNVNRGNRSSSRGNRTPSQQASAPRSNGSNRPSGSSRKNVRPTAPTSSPDNRGSYSGSTTSSATGGTPTRRRRRRQDR